MGCDLYHLCDGCPAAVPDLEQRQFEYEAQLLASLHHPHIVTVRHNTAEIWD